MNNTFKELTEEYLVFLRESLKKWKQNYEYDKKECEFTVLFDKAVIQEIENRIKELEEREI